MRILVVCQEFPPITGGLSVFLHNICIQLSRLGHDVDVLTPFREGGQQMHMGQKYRIYQYKELKFFSSIVPFYHVLSLYFKKKYDLIFVGHLITTNVLGTFFLRLIKHVPYVFLVHGNDLYYSISNWIDRLTARLLLNNTSMILCNSRATARYVSDMGYRENINILHPGVDSKNFNPKVDTSTLIQRYHLAEHKVLLSVSRLVERKEHEQVLRALPKVIKEVPNVLYVIAGQGKRESHLRKTAIELGIDSKVIFTGYVEDTELPSLYCTCDVFIMPCIVLDNKHDYEGFGIVFNEANACGKPVIAGRSGGIEDAVIDGVTGLLVNPENTEEISQAISRLLIDKEFAQKLGENGRKRTESELSWEKVGQGLDQYLHSVIVNIR